MSGISCGNIKVINVLMEGTPVNIVRQDDSGDSYEVVVIGEEKSINAWRARLS